MPGVTHLKNAADLEVIVEIFTYPRQVTNYRKLIYVKELRGTDARQLKQLGGTDRSCSEQDFMARIERLDVITGPNLDTRRLRFVGMFSEQNPACVCRSTPSGSTGSSRGVKTRWSRSSVPPDVDSFENTHSQNCLPG